jgi:hypothetical protein
MRSFIMLLFLKGCNRFFVADYAFTGNIVVSGLEAFFKVLQLMAYLTRDAPIMLQALDT